MRECNENLDGQRANVPQVYVETEVSQVVNEDRVSSCSCMEDKVSSDGPCIFCVLPGSRPVSYTHLDVYKRQV